jgi:fructokinase
VGIGSFGPVDLRRGAVTTTPKPGWAHTDVAGPIGRELGVPVIFDTDVNAAALGEHRWGAARGLGTFVYVTVGTGIGGGGMARGHLLHGLSHPEFGHVRIPHDPADPFPGSCPYHGDCWEGLASGPAIAARWEARPEELPADHPAWALEAEYIALGILSIVLVFSPHRVIVGGGVMEHAGLLGRVRTCVRELVAGYLETPMLAEKIEQYLVPPALGDRAGVLGAIALAQDAATARGPT